jgi:predicted membrane chloride channel (bestrophin family)
VGTLYDYEAMPVPFAFFHILNFILFIYLVLVAYTYTMFSYYYSIIGVFLTALSLLSLRELASVLSDPLGHDDVDLPVFDYAMAVHNNVHKSIFMEPEGEDTSFNES